MKYQLMMKTMVLYYAWKDADADADKDVGVRGPTSTSDFFLFSEGEKAHQEKVHYSLE